MKYQFKKCLLTIVSLAWVALVVTGPTSGSNAQETINCIDRTQRIPYACLLAWNPANEILAVRAFYDILIWDTEQSEVIATLHQDGQSPDAIAWSPDGKLLATADGTYHVNVWDVASQQIQLRLDILEQIEGMNIEGPYYSIQSIAWSPDGTQLSITHDGSVSLWNIQTNMFRVFRPVSRELSFYAQSGAWSPDGKWFAITHQWTRVDLYDGTTLAFLEDSLDSFEGYRIPYTSTQNIVWQADSDYHAIAVQNYNGTASAIIIRNPAFRQLTRILEAGAPIINAIAWSPSGDLLASAHGDPFMQDANGGALRIWGDMTYPAYTELIDEILSEHYVNSVSWNPTGSRLAYSTSDGIVHILEFNIEP